ncbi:unnamed protein product [Orchesella dallaii]|uniref:Uncharacterized protein n=1 Tax=Orchesella dallaii TaxID=48710 RepID=A0ABP1Q028_9HEXA
MANSQDANENYPTLRSYILCEGVEETTMMIQISSMAKAALLQNGMVTPTKLEGGKLYSKPLWIAGDKHQLFYGDQARIIKNSSSLSTQPDIWFYDLADSLTWCFGKKENDFNIMVNGQVKSVALEFLLGLYFKHVKDTVEKAQNINGIRKLLIIVPSWFISIQRQRLQHAGIISGFEEIMLMNEITAIPLFYLGLNGPIESQQLAAAPTSSSTRSFLVINEGSDNIDVATFEYYEDADGRKFLEMIGLHGNQYELEKTEVGIEKKINRIRYLRKRRTIKQMTSLANDLLEDACDKFKESGRKLEDLEVMIYGHSSKWICIFEDLISLTYGDTMKMKIVFNHWDFMIDAGETSQLNQVIKIHSQALPDKIVELNAFAFYQRDSEECFVPDVLFKQGEKQPEDELRVSLSMGIRGTTHLVAYQRNVTGIGPNIGHLEMSKLLYYLYSEIGTSFTVDRNGILKFKDVFGVTSKGSKDEVVPEKYFTWRCTYLSQVDVEYFQLLLNEVLEYYCM